MRLPLDVPSRKLLLVAGLLMLQLDVVAAAVPAGGSMLEEVIVTAQKRESRLQDTPIAISAYSETALEAIGATEFTRIADYTPNVVIAPMPGQNGTIISIRGIGSGDPASAIDPKVGLYIDGVYVARSTGNVFELDLESIEVLRGPQGTLWGKNTTGGSINVTTAKPSGEFGLQQDVSSGDFGYRYARTRLDSPTVALGGAGHLSSRLTYLAKRYEGWAERVNQLTPGPEDLGEIDSDYLRFALRWQPFDSLSLDYSYDDHERSGAARQDQLLRAVPGLNADAFAEPNRRLERFRLNSAGSDRLDAESHTLTVAWEVGQAVFKSITGHRKSDTFFQPDLDGNPVLFTSLILSSFSLHTGGIYDFLGTRDHEQFSQEVQVVGSALAGRLEYTGGLYYFTEEGGENSTTSLYLASFGVFADLSKIYTVENESRAAYGQVSYTPDLFSGRLRLTLGGRYSEDDKQADKTLHNGQPTALHGNKQWDNFSMAGVAEYRVTDTVNTYARIAEGYNAGIFNIRSSQTDTFGVPAEEETVTSYELGVKSELADRRLRLNAAAFLSEYRDMQQLIFVGGSESVAVNVGDAELYGIELEALLALSAAFTVGANYAWLDHDIKEFVTDGTDVSDQATIAFSTDNTASAFVEYTRPLHGIGTLSVRLDGVYKGKVAFAPLNFESAEADSYTVYNGRISLTDLQLGDTAFSLALWGRNLTDEEYRVFGIDFGEFQTGTFGDPQAFGLDITLSLR